MKFEEKRTLLVFGRGSLVKIAFQRRIAADERPKTNDGI